ncbi:MAG: hypothetical protein ACFCU1_00835 [Sumerlaeia bacterium]
MKPADYMAKMQLTPQALLVSSFVELCIAGSTPATAQNIQLSVLEQPTAGLL